MGKSSNKASRKEKKKEESKGPVSIGSKAVTKPPLLLKETSISALNINALHAEREEIHPVGI